MVTRLSGGLSPADGSDPRTFPQIWNVTADEIETAQSDITSLQGSVVSLGSAVSNIELDVLDLEQDKAAVVVAGSNSVSLDFASQTPLVTRSASSGTVVVTGTNYESGVTRTLRIIGGTAISALTVPSDWVFVGQSVGTSIGTATTVIITATSFGTVATDVVAAYAEEA